MLRGGQPVLRVINPSGKRAQKSMGMIKRVSLHPALWNTNWPSSTRFCQSSGFGDRQAERRALELLSRSSIDCHKHLDNNVSLVYQSP